jgi:hypothetical protein
MSLTVFCPAIGHVTDKEVVSYSMKMNDEATHLKYPVQVNGLFIDIERQTLRLKYSYLNQIPL